MSNQMTDEITTVSQNEEELKQLLVRLANDTFLINTDHLKNHIYQSDILFWCMAG